MVRDEMVAFGLAEGRAVVLPNGVPIRPDPPQTRESSEVPRRLNIGRLDRQKGQDILIRAVAASRASREPWQLLLAGGVTAGPSQHQAARYADRLHRLVDELSLGDSVKFLGWVRDTDALMSSADMYVHSARGRALRFRSQSWRRCKLVCRVF